MSELMNQEVVTIESIRNFDGKYPKQLWYLFLVEMWERFCFYGMRGILTIFMVDQLAGFNDKKANLTYGAIQAFVYAFTFIGGIFADKILGFKRSLTFGALLMILGNAIIAFSPTSFFYYGITLSIVGTGFFKPNVSSMVGELYADGDPRRDAGFSIFYSGINMGAFFGGMLCVWLGKNYGWSQAFGAASIVMVIGLVVFEITKKSLGPIGNSPLANKGLEKKQRTPREVAVYIGAFLCMPLIYLLIQNTSYTDRFMLIIGILAVAYFLIQLFKVQSIQVRKKLVAAFILILFYIIFCAIFEQAGGSLALFAKNNLHDKLLFFHIDPNIINNSANSLFVIILSPIFGLIWLALAKKKMEPHTAIKFTLSFLFLAGAYYLYYSERFFMDASGKTSLNIFTLAYLVVTFSELCLSPVGLSMITKLSPSNLSGMMMGLWFLASAYGQYVAGKLGADMSTENINESIIDKLLAYTNGYKEMALYSIAAAVIMLLLYPMVKRLMQNIK